MSEAARIIDRIWTLAEFRAADFGDERVELIDGEVVAHAAPSRSHARLTSEIGRALGNAIERSGAPCVTETGSDIPVEGRTIGLPRDSALIPDLQVRCGDPEGEDEPSIVVEVLSPSNTATEMMLKLRAYMALPGITDILFVHQDQHFIHHHRRGPGGWTGPDSLEGPEAVLRIERVGLEVTLGTLYRNVLPATPAAS